MGFCEVPRVVSTKQGAGYNKGLLSGAAALRILVQVLLQKSLSFQPDFIEFKRSFDSCDACVFSLYHLVDE